MGGAHWCGQAPPSPPYHPALSPGCCTRKLTAPWTLVRHPTAGWAAAAGLLEGAVPDGSSRSSPSAAAAAAAAMPAAAAAMVAGRTAAAVAPEGCPAVGWRGESCASSRGDCSGRGVSMVCSRSSTLPTGAGTAGSEIFSPATRRLRRSNISSSAWGYCKRQCAVASS